VGAGQRVSEQQDQLLLDVGRDGVLPAVGLAVHLLPLEADHVEQQPLGQTVSAHHARRELPALLRERDAAIGAQVQEAVLLEATDGLGDCCRGEPESLDEARPQRGDALLLEIEDLLEVLLGRVMHLSHRGQDTLTSMGASAVVACRGLTKQFGDVRAVDAVDLDVREGELLALLGPSGCGKTTTLRLVAGFERPDAGTVVLDGHEVAGPSGFVAAEKRRVGVVFQDFALFPHLSVAANVGYGVRDRAQRPTRVAELLDLVGLNDEGTRLPHELSGGQQQRVALARALAPAPAIVLLDEPFSNLDASMRVEMRSEVRAILAEAKATAVVVTHDQEEALSLADRVAVMRDGRLLQVDTAADLYAHPVDRFVATFVGDADVIPGRADGAAAVTALGRLPLAVAGGTSAVEVVVRPERVRLRLDSAGEGVVRAIVSFGHDQLVAVELVDGTRVRSRMGPGRAFEPGDRVSVSVAGDVLAFPASAAAGASPKETGGKR